MQTYSYLLKVWYIFVIFLYLQDQYIFLHDALLEASEGFDTIIPLSEFKSQCETLRTKQSKGKSQIQVQYEVSMMFVSFTDRKCVRIMEDIAP